MAGKIQNADIKSLVELQSKGADKTYLPSTEKAYSPKSNDVLENVLRKNNYTAIVNPSISDDSISNYEIGSRWTNLTDQSNWVCIDNTSGNAQWKNIISSINGLTGDVVLDANNIAETSSRYWSLKDNKNATLPPDANNDITQNYVVGSQWYDKITHILYICDDNTSGAAVWSAISGAGGSGSGIGGVSLKARGFTMTDGSQNEFNVQIPFVNVDGNTQINHDFEVLDSELMRIFLDGKKIPKFIDALTTPAPFYKILDNFNIELDQDYSASALSLEIEVYAGVDVPTVVPSILAGLAIKFEQAFDSVVDGVFNGVSTEFTLSQSILNNDVGMLFIDGVFQAKKSASVVSGTWSLLSNNKISIDGDLTLLVKNIYVVFFEGSSQVDAFGNVCLTLRPKLTSIVLQDGASQKHVLGVSTSGQLEITQVPDGVVDPIRFKRDDLTIISLEVDLNGNLVVNDNPTAGIVVDNIFLSDANGLAWELQVDNLNVLYIVDGVGNKWCLNNDVGSPFFEIEEGLNGTVMSAKTFASEIELPNPPNVSTGNTNFSICYVDGIPHFKIYDSVGQKWLTVPVQVTGKAQDVFPVGHCMWSVLTEAEFLVEMNDPNGDRWSLMESKPLVDTDKLKQIKGWGVLPDSRGLGVRVTDNGRGLDPDVNSRIKHEADISMIGSFQNDELKSHTHPYTTPAVALGFWGNNAQYRHTSQTGSSTGASGGNETRMKNINLNLFIKYNY